ncbi:peptidase M23, partial [Microbispora triticiradicis]
MSPRTARLISPLAAVAAAAVLGGTVLATASPASAATRNGVCETGEFCYY